MDPDFKQWLKGFIAAVAVALILLATIVAAILFYDGTFGGRCEHAYPISGLEQERCVDRLVDGGKI